MPNFPKPVVLIILDGWGIAPASQGNAISLAKLPNYSHYLNIYPHGSLAASQEAVGLPIGEQGSSETGHLNLGAGTTVIQSLTKINQSIEDKSFFNNPVLTTIKDHLIKNSSNLHLLGLIGPAGVHSSLNHLFSLLSWAKDNHIKNVYLHLFTDGRDSPPYSSLIYLNLIEEKLKFYKLGSIATIMGRFYSMDRDNRWNRIEKAYQALTEGKGLKTNNYQKIIQELHLKKISDEFIEPLIIEKGNQVNLIKNNDAVIFFNFRVDRPRELTKSFVLAKDNFKDFNRQIILKNLLFATMTDYESGLPVLWMYPSEEVSNPLALVLANHGLKQLRIAETEKVKHITYYFDGKRDQALPNEDRIIIPSSKVLTYDLTPEMSAFEITKELIKRINTKKYDFIAVNFANPDMVGHTGNLKAGIIACETVDKCLGLIVNKINKIDGICLITGDHGNVEEMINLENNSINTQHSCNKVPFIITNKKYSLVSSGGVLADVAPTILKLLNIQKPIEMTGKSLI